MRPSPPRVHDHQAQHSVASCMDHTRVQWLHTMAGGSLLPLYVSSIECCPGHGVLHSRQSYAAPIGEAWRYGGRGPGHARDPPRAVEARACAPAVGAPARFARHRRAAGVVVTTPAGALRHRGGAAAEEGRTPDDSRQGVILGPEGGTGLLRTLCLGGAVAAGLVVWRLQNCG